MHDRWLGARAFGPAVLALDPVLAAPPAGIDRTVGINEDGSYTFGLVDFGFTDTDGDSLASVRIASVPASGRLFLDADGPGGNAPSHIQFSGTSINAFDLANGRLTFVPAADGFGSPYTSFTFQVQDSGNQLDPTPNTFTFNVAPINDAPFFQAFEGSVMRVSTGSAGQQIGSTSWHPSISPDGTRVVFDSLSGDYVPPDSNFADIFLKDLNTGAVTLVSVNALGEKALGNSVNPVFSPDGTKVAFTSNAANLVAGDTNGMNDVFVKDLITGAVTRVSTYANGLEADSYSYAAVFSPDGTKVMFLSPEPFLGGSSQGEQLYIKDLTTGSVTLVSTTDTGAAALTGVFGKGSFSADGTKVAFTSFGANVAGDTNGRLDVFVRDLTTGSVTRVSTSSDGSEGNGHSQDAILSPDGTKVAFMSQANNLVGNDTNGVADIFIKDLLTGVTTRVSTDSMGGQLSDPSLSSLAFSPDGSMLFFRTGFGETYVKNLLTGELVTLWSLVGATDWTGPAHDIGFSADGSRMVFYSSANNIVPGDTNSSEDVFVINLNDPPVYAVGGPPLQVAPVVSVSDIDSANYNGGSLSVALTAGQAAGDQIGLTSSTTPGSGVEVSGANVSYNGVVVGTLTINNAFSFVVAFNANATDAAVEAVAEAVNFSIASSVAPDGPRTITFTLVDGGGTAGGGADSASFSRTIVVDFGGSNSAPVARNDSFATNESAAVSGSVFNDNGAGADSDVDGPPLSIAEVQGSAANVGVQITLASGALLTLAADGTFVYDPNGAFDHLPVPASGGAGTPATDSFTYRLAGGGTATVTVTIAGLDTDDTISGTAGADTLRADGGVDTLVGLGGNDTLFVRPSSLVTEAVGGGSDYVVAAESYVLNSGAEVELISTTDNNGTAAIDLTGNEFGQVIVGNDGANYLDGGGGADLLVGRGGNDTYIVDADDRVAEDSGGGAQDYVAARTSYVLTAGAAVELLSTTNNGGSATIDLTGNEYGQVLVGNAGANRLDGGGGTDVLVGLGGNDSYLVDADDQVVEGAAGGSDYVAARASYVLQAGVEVELLSTIDNGGTAFIHLAGNEFNQVLVGNAGNTVLDGKGGNDILVGLGGLDGFLFTTALGSGNVDTIIDFNVADDTIGLDDAIFTTLALGLLNPNAFVTGSAATTAAHRIVYDSATGNLFYDADGNGAGAAVLFATLQGAPALTANDFNVI